MSELSGCPETCCLHKLRFAEVKEFPDDEVDFTDVLSTFAVGRCQATCRPKDGAAVQIPLCREDIEETDDASLFDGKGFLVAVCHRHAPLVLSRAVEGRACTGEACCGDADTDGQLPSPRVGRMVIGKRLYCSCEECGLHCQQVGKDQKYLRVLNLRYKTRFYS